MYPSPTRAVMAGVTPVVQHSQHRFDPINAGKPWTMAVIMSTPRRTCLPRRRSPAVGGRGVVPPNAPDPARSDIAPSNSAC